MFKIEWNKTDVEQKIRAGEGETGSLDIWTPLHVIVNGVDITGLGEAPIGRISNLEISL